jgi:AcrR family transcriptional regulator
MTKMENGTKKKLIDAATSLIGEQGDAQNVTTRDIAARAGVGIGLVNYHFQTKERLLDLCTQRLVGMQISRFGSLYEGLDMDPIGKLRFLLKENARFLANNPGISRTSIAHDLMNPGPGDSTFETLQAYLPVVREACGGKATGHEALVVLHTAIFTLQFAYLRKNAFVESCGFDLADEKQRDQFIDILVYVLFHKYL